MWGDWLALLLAEYGITPKAWNWLLVKLRLAKPGKCYGCLFRRQLLNRVGYLATALIGRLITRQLPQKKPL